MYSFKIGVKIQKYPHTFKTDKEIGQETMRKPITHIHSQGTTALSIVPENTKHKNCLHHNIHLNSLNTVCLNSIYKNKININFTHVMLITIK